MTPQAKHKALHPERQRAYKAVYDAIKSGELIRPSTCGVCGEPERFGSDGRTLLHAHHHLGYDAWSDVQWVCPSCHKAIDGGACGIRNRHAKLCESDVLDIRRSEERTEALAGKFGVHRATIDRIRKGDLWRSLA